MSAVAAIMYYQLSCNLSRMLYSSVERPCGGSCQLQGCTAWCAACMLVAVPDQHVGIIWCDWCMSPIGYCLMCVCV